MRCRLSNREVGFVCIQIAAAAAAAAALCCYTAVVAAAAAAVRHRLPDAQFFCWFTESDPSVFFLFIRTRFIFDAPPLAVLCRIYGLDLLRLVITGMRGANAGVSSPRRSPPCIINILYSKPSLLAAAQPAYTNISIGTCLY